MNIANEKNNYLGQNGESKIYVGHFLKPVGPGVIDIKEHEHITFIPPAKGLNTKNVQKDLSTAIEIVPDLMQARTLKLKRYGRVLVREVQRTEKMLRLHIELVAILKRDGFLLDETFTGDDWSPHISVVKHAGQLRSVPSQSLLTIHNLILLQDKGDGYKAIKNIEFGKCNKIDK